MKGWIFIILAISIPMGGWAQEATLSPKSVEKPVPQLTEGFAYKCYPNPFAHTTIITFPNPEGKRYHLYLIDLSGRVVRSYGGFEGEKIEIKRDGLAEGVYLFELRGDRSYFGRIVLE